MKRLLLLVLLTATLAATVSACKTDAGSREYAPGKGWKPAK